MMITLNAIQSYISDTLLEGQQGSVAADQDLLTSGLLDSLNVMKLANYLEETCSITIPAQDVVLENFATIEKMHSYLAGRGAAT